MILTPKEQQILQWIVDGKARKWIASEYGISEVAIQHHINSAREKLDCETTYRLIAKVCFIGIVKDKAEF